MPILIWQGGPESLIDILLCHGPRSYFGSPTVTLPIIILEKLLHDHTQSKGVTIAFCRQWDLNRFMIINKHGFHIFLTYPDKTGAGDNLVP